MRGAAYYNEIDPYCAQWLRNLIEAGHIAPGEVDERDVRDVAPDDLRGFSQCHFFAGIGVWSYALRLAGWEDDRPVWTGSCPCQPFSAAGRGAGFADERHLWPHWLHLIRVCRPGVVFGEQVASKDGLAWLDLVQADMEGEIYAFGAVDLCVAGVGAPHIRQRLCFVADANGRQCIGITGGKERECDGQATRWQQGDCELKRGGEAGKLGFADSDGREPRVASAPPLGHGGSAVATGSASELGHPIGAGSQERPQPEIEPGSLRIQGAAFGAAEPVRGFWRGADWIFCRDGKYRPVEPGTFPLVDGAAFRVGSGSAFEGQSRTGMLRAYGNAISPWPTAEVIAAYMDCRRAA